MNRFLFMGVQEDPAFDEIEARGITRIYDGTKRDEFSCPCCGTPTDSHYCDACDKAECGERDYNDPNIGVCLAKEGK